ncbi:FKBP-type peptidyl-prolyl cis-trans isomerase [Microbacterium awajiense]|uniref:Peptidyl-prolyl cis-trans isomerase n=1 Tax=Microbacterium awajiense TaxID=415214 RepID=A0ABP7AF11_9MICO
MRFRSVAAVSAAALTALVLAGCTSTAEPSESPASADPSVSDAALCEAVAESGEASEAVTVEGTAGEPSEVTFEFPLDIPALQSTVIDEGSGDPVEAGQLVSYALSAFSADTGEKLGDIGYGDTPVLPAQISAENPIGQIIGCAAPGARVVATFPPSDAAGGEVYVFDFLGVVPDAAWGEEQPAVEGMPTVELAEDGTPSVTLPDGDIPTEFEKATLKEGDGQVVEQGDAVLVQYHGVSWDTGEVFDQSWGGQPFTFSTNGGVVQGFADAVLGETVGSQVIAILPPSVAYGEGEINDADLTGQTLVFVVDILGVQPESS